MQFFLHLDEYLSVFLATYGLFSYSILFLVIFLETGLVLTPFLPGDSLLFGLGALAGQKLLRLDILAITLSIAAVTGDSLNYYLGRRFGVRLFTSPGSAFLNAEHLHRTEEFYARWGGQAIFLARFVPVVRTFAPFVAGIAHMSYAQFFIYNVFGGIVWVGTFLGGGYLFGDTPFVRDNFSIVIVVIIVLSLLPGIIGMYRHRR